MKDQYYRQKAIEYIRGYLDGRVTWQQASNWATKVIASDDDDRLEDSDVEEAILLLFDLHDYGLLPVPSKDRLRGQLAVLEAKEPLAD